MISLIDCSVRMGGRWVLDGVSLTVAPGSAAVVTGPNGCGKSVLVRTAAGLLVPSAGRVLVDGVPARRRRARRGLGYLPQGAGLYDYLTALENLRFAAAMAGIGWRRRASVCSDLLELVGLGGGGLTRAFAGELTPGQRRRLAIARTLVGDPKALVLDEPLAGLDADGRADLRHLLGELAGMGKAILIAAGDPDGLACDQLLQLAGGRLKGGEAA